MRGPSITEADIRFHARSVNVTKFLGWVAPHTNSLRTALSRSNATRRHGGTEETHCNGASPQKRFSWVSLLPSPRNICRVSDDLSAQPSQRLSKFRGVRTQEIFPLSRLPVN